MDRDFEQVASLLGDDAEAEQVGADDMAPTQFSTEGPVPEVSEDRGDAGPSASEMAFGDDNVSYTAMSAPSHDADETEDDEHEVSDAEHDTAGGGETRALASAARSEPVVRYRGGEPLPVLKTYVQGEPTRGKLAAFISMMKRSPRRQGAGVRTPTSPADGLAAIITGVILRICHNYSDVAKGKQKRFLDRTVADHLKLLSLPLRRGGHRRRGIVGKQNDGLAGPTRPYSVVTANQTAVVLTSMMRLHGNDDFKKHHGRIMRLYKVLMPEFKQGLLELYPPGVSPSRWCYGSSGRLEDQSHLKTTFEELKSLAKVAPEADGNWCERQVERIGKAYPRVKRDWEDNDSNVAGSLR